MKKILSFSIAGLLVAVFIATIVTALVKSSFYYPIQNDKVLNIQVWKDGSKYHEYMTANKDDAEIINEILSLNKKGFNETVLASVFLNHYAHKTNVVYQSQNVNNLITSPSNEFVIVLDFTNYYQENTQTLELFGEVYKDTNIPTGDNTVQFKKMIFQVSNTDTLAEITIYLENTVEAVPSLSNSLYQIKTLGKQDALYKYLKHITSA